MAANYFKVTRITWDGKSRDSFFFFDDSSLPSVSEAYRDASSASYIISGNLSVFSPPPAHRGRWDQDPLVGHRPYDSILADIVAAAEAGNKRENTIRSSEMDALQARWRGLPE